MEVIKTKSEALDNAWMAASEELYNAQAQAQPGADAGQGNPETNPGTEDVQDADFEEVK